MIVTFECCAYYYQNVYVYYDICIGIANAHVKLTRGLYEEA